MQQLIEKPHFDERHEAPLLLHSGIPGIRTALRDTLKATQEVIKEVTAHGVNEITIERDSSGRIVKKCIIPKSDKAGFLNGAEKQTVVLPSIIPNNDAGAEVTTYKYFDDTELVRLEIKKKYISNEKLGALSSTTETANTYTPDGQIDTIKVQWIGATDGKKIMIHSSAVLKRTDKGQPVEFRIDRESKNGIIKSVRKVRDYDVKGNIISETDYNWDDQEQSPSSLLSRSEMKYDDRGRITEVKLTEGGETRLYKYFYESLADGKTVISRKSFTGTREEISERSEFDKNGNQISYSTRLAPNAQPMTTKWIKVDK